MADHLSEFALEIQAIGDQAPDGHLQTCAACRGRLQWLREHSATVRRSEGYARVAEQIGRRPAAAGRKPLGRWLALVAVPGLAAAAAAFLLHVSSAGGPENEIKGAPTVEVVQAKSQVETHLVKPGDRVALKVGAATFPWLLVVAVDDGGVVEPLWPAASTRSGPAPRGSAALLAPEFTITPGSLTVLSLFSDRPLSVEALRKSLSSGAADRLEALDLPGRFKVATWTLCVEGSPCRQQP